MADHSKQPCCLVLAIWLGDTVKAHQQGQCLDVHKVFIIGCQILAPDSPFL